jgi:hypothetical protein
MSGRILKNMKPWRIVGHALSFGVVTLLIVAAAPAVLVFGELVNRHLRRRGLPGRRGRAVVLDAGPGWATYTVAGRSHMVARRVLANPVWIALTAPARWVLDRLRPRAGSGRGRGGNGPPGAGVREPRRPLPDLPAGAMALPEPGPFD